MLGSGRAAVGGTLMSGDVGNGLLDGGAGGKAIFSCDCQCMSQNFISVVFCIKKTHNNKNTINDEGMLSTGGDKTVVDATPVIGACICQSLINMFGSLLGSGNGALVRGAAIACS